MTEDFFRFPSTPHLAVLPGLNIRDDKLLTPFGQNEMLQHELLIEEKVDGANLGISFDADGSIRTQNRGAWISLPGKGQWKKLDTWLAARTDALFDALTDRYILFGEWCYARHSVAYDRLPDWFLGFDVFDRRAGRFLSAKGRDRLCSSLPIAMVPSIGRGRFSLPQLMAMPGQSKLSSEPVEGLYLRLDDDDWLLQRAKLVRADFIQAVEEHWSRRAIQPNRLLS